MLAISSKSRYAVTGLTELALRGGPEPVPLAEIARRREIPVQFLESLFASLRRAGILRSQRGVGGGYAFARPPEQVTVLEIVELLDGAVAPPGEPSGSVWAELSAAVAGVLGATTVAELAQREARAARTPMYYI